MLTVGQEGSLLTKFNGGKFMQEVVFTANGEYLLGLGGAEVQVWRVNDGEQMATVNAYTVGCFAVSQDGRLSWDDECARGLRTRAGKPFVGAGDEDSN